MPTARKILTQLRQGSHDAESISDELQDIKLSVESRRRSTKNSFIALSLSLFQEPALFARLWRAFLLQFMAQMCGATAMKYYLPTLLKALGLSTRLALMAGALETTAKIGMTVIEMWLIDRFGRKVCLVSGSLVMGFAMLVSCFHHHLFLSVANIRQINGILPLSFPNNSNHIADGICIAFIFIYAMGYSIGLGPAAWIYSSEVISRPECP